MGLTPRKRPSRSRARSRLSAAYSQVYALAVELSVCARLDPRSLDVAAVVRNAGLLAELEAILLPRLRRQNDRACSALSLELVHLLENSREASAALLAPGILNTYHKTLFPDTKLSSLYLWHNFSRRRSVPVPSGASAEEYSDLALFVDGGSRAHEESNVIDVVPGNLVTYAKQRLNNAILKACGQTQFYISLIQGLVPRTQSVPARDYPHVLGTRAVESAAAYAEATSSLTATTVVCAATDCLSQVCKARPVVTLPVTINKYTGVNGNNQIFQAGNLGYFMGRGVDRNLLQAPGAGLRKQAGGSSMRKKFVFATPTLGLTVKRRTQAATTYEIENIRAGLEAIISQKQEEDCVFDVVCNLVDAMGEACASLTRDDAEYLLGRFSVLADTLQTWLRQSVAAQTTVVAVREEVASA